MCMNSAWIEPRQRSRTRHCDDEHCVRTRHEQPRILSMTITVAIKQQPVHCKGAYNLTTRKTSPREREGQSS